MTRVVRHEQELSCEQCRFFVRAARRELKLFPDGRNYMVTGTCGNQRSILHGLEITGSMTASVNAVHRGKAGIAAKLDCFEAKE